jgi:hypothetical protein
MTNITATIVLVLWTNTVDLHRIVPNEGGTAKIIQKSILMTDTEAQIVWKGRTNRIKLESAETRVLWTKEVPSNELWYKIQNWPFIHTNISFLCASNIIYSRSIDVTNILLEHE